ncbi:PREDICTED: myosin regulatory light chain 2, ventricular/cardiac muscle isoform-like [Hipposideros armiger]|uniref:EF-hand calcium-binding domain-containing protein 11 n=1 Tax=Hipposideros armiger TaxID=186990 RepID=A0A8B7RU63_HIPAR|nr:PREDICTED: myosin regulatory light chain 2, ventricular/cardiac muscle isoform-like [Hipposideros armiger]
MPMSSSHFCPSSEALSVCFLPLGRVNVKNEEIDDMIKEAPGPINFTVFLTMFGEKLKGADPEETILNAFKVFDPEGKGVLKADYIKEMLTTQAERFSKEEVTRPFGHSLYSSSCRHPSRDSISLFLKNTPDSTLRENLLLFTEPLSHFILSITL